MDINVGLNRYKDLLAKARARGEVVGPLGLEGWKPATKATLAQIGYKKAKKAKAKPGKHKPKAKVEFDLYGLVSIVRESGEFERLIPHCGKGVTIKSILEWHEQETFAREMAEKRKVPQVAKSAPRTVKCIQYR